MTAAMTARTTVEVPPAIITERNMANLANHPASGGIPARLKKNTVTSTPSLASRFFFEVVPVP